MKVSRSDGGAGPARGETDSHIYHEDGKGLVGKEGTASDGASSGCAPERQGTGDEGSPGIPRGAGNSKKFDRPLHKPPPPRPKLGGRPMRSKWFNPLIAIRKQDYGEIKEECLRKGCLFEDPAFCFERDTEVVRQWTAQHLKWIRPTEITNNPEWISAGASRFDVRQGELGDCWLLAAVASLTCNQKLFNKVVPPDQNFTDDYCGVFRFNFWHQGDWTEVVVDDRLPTYQGRLVFMHSTQKNEYWSALLEKAYAKMMGSYEALRGGQTSEAMEDFTGGVTEMFPLGREQPPNLLKIMLKAHERGALMGCSIDADPHRVEAELANGLIMGHAYSITSIRLLDMKTSRVQGKMPLVRVRNPWGNEAEWKGPWSDGQNPVNITNPLPHPTYSSSSSTSSNHSLTHSSAKFSALSSVASSAPSSAGSSATSVICYSCGDRLKIALVRVRNPWGNESEWKGAWCDGSPEWSIVTEQQKRDLGLKKDDDGEFWMSFQDFTSNFQKLEICNLSPDSLDSDDLGNKKRWEVHKEHSSWVKRVSAGGCRNFLDTFWTNPQFRMTLSDVDDDDDDDLCTAIIAVLQKDRRKKRNQGIDLLTIGYVIYKLDVVQVAPLDLDFFKYNSSVAKSPTFINMREVCGRHQLPPGTYCIVPSTFDPNNEGDFLIRIFTEKPNSSGGLDEETKMADDVGSPGISVPAPGWDGQRLEHKHVNNSITYMKRPLPSQEEQRQENSLMDTFQRVAGEDLEVDARELQTMLDGAFSREFTFGGFNIEAARSMVAMYDGDMSGKLGFDEFKELLTDLRHWKSVFKQFDKDQNGTLSSFELRTALNSTGFRLSNRTLQSLVMRYSHSDGKINFSDFITCSVRLKTMINTFKDVDTRNQGVAPFTMENFLQTTMYS